MRSWKPKKPYKARGKQQETPLQRNIVDSLNASGWGYFFRIRNGATFDPIRGIWRSNTAEKGIPDIHGFMYKASVACYVEVKYLAAYRDKKKLVYTVKTSAEQDAFLLRAHRAGCRAGVAFCIEDALAIVSADPERYPRHPRTYCFLPKAEKEAYAEEYKAQKKVLTEEARDPIKYLQHGWPKP